MATVFSVDEKTVEVVEHKNNLEKIKAIYKQYINSKYLYKKCIDCEDQDKSRIWLIILEKLIDSKTNEKRKNVANKKYAKFRANKLNIVEIININSPDITKTQITHKCGDSKVIYKVGSTICSSHYDENIEHVRTNGVHYFKTIDCAYFYKDIPIDHSGPIYNWYNDGRKAYEGYYLEGIKTGKWIFWYGNGDVKCQGEYKNGLQEGKWKFWYENKQKSFLKRLTNKNRKHVKGIFLKGEKTGKWTFWYENGKKKREGFYLTDKKIGKWAFWNDKKSIEKIY